MKRELVEKALACARSGDAKTCVKTLEYLVSIWDDPEVPSQAETMDDVELAFDPLDFPDVTHDEYGIIVDPNHEWWFAESVVETLKNMSWKCVHLDEVSTERAEADIRGILVTARNQGLIKRRQR